MDKAVVQGVKLSRLRIAIESDPDPADDSTMGVLEEPANDWPEAPRRARQSPSGQHAGSAEVQAVSGAFARAKSLRNSSIRGLSPNRR